MLAIYPRPAPKFSRNFLDGAGSVRDAVARYVRAVRAGEFPGADPEAGSE
jgi:3-methyl-2-oxobutanoate hydroxymethyltransferase